MPPRTSGSRGQTIPRVAWWCDAATAAADRSGLTRQQIADDLERAFGYSTTDASVIRCLSGQVLTIELAQHLSAMFGLPPPVIFPQSEEESWALVAKQEAERVRAQVRLLAARIDHKPDDQSAPVPSEDGRKSKRGRLGRVR